jgi:regulator of sigma E protease
MEILIKGGQLLLSLTILVIFHEFGHFLFARLFKTRVEKFYLFFNPWFSLFKFKKGDTEWGVGWVPLGGYVKISGMIDESMDVEAMKLPPQPHEFRSKKSWQRLLIMVGGVLVNILLAFVIYAMVLMVWGESYLPTENAKYGIVADPMAQKIGFQNGDKILTLDGKKIDNFLEIQKVIILDDVKTIKVQRDSIQVDVNLTKEVIPYMLKNKSFIRIGIPFIVEDYAPESTAKKAGILKGDRLIGINDKKMMLFEEYPDELLKLKGQEVKVQVLRNGSQVEIPVKVTDKGKLGLAPLQDPEKLFTLKTKEYGFFAAIPAGISRGVTEIVDYLKQFKLIFNKETEAYKSVGGFIAIAKIFPAEWDWYAFWRMTALLSIVLGVLNILPIPALDGGHVIFLLYEVVTGRRPSDKFLEYAQVVGLVLLLGLLVFANGNDIWKLFKG